MVSHHKYLMNHLADPVEAAAYLNSVAEDGEIQPLLKALRNVVEAQGGIGGLAKKTKLSRTTLYKTLSSKGNPAVITLNTILSVYNIQMRFSSITPEESSHLRQAASSRRHSALYATP
jgi:probable addiction module antidote protein